MVLGLENSVDWYLILGYNIHIMQNKHIPFDISKIRIERVTVHKISQSTIEPAITFSRVGRSEKHQAILPAAVGRTLYLTANKISNFLVGYPVDLLWVGDDVLCAIGPNKAEVQHSTVDASYVWKSNIAANIATLKQLTATWSREQYFDGQYIYSFVGDTQAVDGNFGYRRADTINLHHAYRSVFVPKVRAGFAYKSSGGWTVTPPVTAVSNDGRLQLQGDADELVTNSAAIYNTFGTIDTLRFVNLCFVNFATRRLTDTFDYTVTEPLGIPLLMIEQHTFNLGSISREVQLQIEAPLKFTHALAWLIGLHNTATGSLSEVQMLKQCIKMLLTKGCTRTIAAKLDPEAEVPGNKQDIVKSLRDTLSSAPLITF